MCVRETIRTHNIDFAKSRAQQNEDIDADTRAASVVMFQECRDTILDDLVPRRFANNQHKISPSKRGSAIAWDTTKWKWVRGGIRLGTDNHGVKMNPRWIKIAVLQHRETGKKVKFISCHFPPLRYRWLQPGMAAALVRVMNRGEKPVVVGTDANFLIREDKYGIRRKTQTTSRSEGIIGFYLSPRLKPGRYVVGEKCNSDHRAGQITIDV